jgi:hypothetical protein
MIMTSAGKQLVADVAAVHFGAINAPIRRGVEIDAPASVSIRASAFCRAGSAPRCIA